MVNDYLLEHSSGWRLRAACGSLQALELESAEVDLDKATLEWKARVDLGASKRGAK